MDMLMQHLDLNKIPESWEKYAYESLKNTEAWFENLQFRF